MEKNRIGCDILRWKKEIDRITVYSKERNSKCTQPGKYQATTPRKALKWKTQNA